MKDEATGSRKGLYLINDIIVKKTLFTFTFYLTTF